MGLLPKRDGALAAILTQQCEASLWDVARLFVWYNF